MFAAEPIVDMHLRAHGVADYAEEKAPFLSQEQKGDIFLDNAVRFLRLDARKLTTADAL